jgi:hypothetical protein
MTRRWFLMLIAVLPATRSAMFRPPRPSQCFFDDGTSLVELGSVPPPKVKARQMKPADGLRAQDVGTTIMREGTTNAGIEE